LADSRLRDVTLSILAAHKFSSQQDTLFFMHTCALTYQSFELTFSSPLSAAGAAAAAPFSWQKKPQKLRVAGHNRDPGEPRF
jgi:hypothetical protein